MEVNEEFIQRVIESQKTKNEWRNKFDSIQFKEANFLNQSLFGEKLKPTEGCECLPTFFFNLNVLRSKNKIFEKMEKKFFIKKGKIIMNHSFAMPLGFHSSDEDCIKLLKLNEKHINSFEKAPDNWREIVFGTAAKKESVKVEAIEETTTENENETIEENVSEIPASQKPAATRKYKKRK